MSYTIMLHWVREREAVRERKESGQPYPWTDDPIISTYRFCNVRREDDYVTRWVKEHIREKFFDHKYLWFMLCIARMINLPDTLVRLMWEDGAWPSHEKFDPKIMGSALEDVAFTGKAFTGAYIIPSPKDGKKPRWLAEKVLGQLWRDRAIFESHFNGTLPRGINGRGLLPTLKSTHEMLVRYDFWDTFLAYQAVVDMRFTKLLEGAEDVATSCAAGPGTIRGLNRLACRQLAGGMHQLQDKAELVQLWDKLVKHTGIKMDLSDVPNVCCEYDKYMRVKNGEGKPRATYVPGRGS